MTQFGPAMYSVVSEFANGSFSPGTHFSTLAEGGIGITVSPLISEHLSAEDKAAFDEGVADVEAVSEKIKAGELTVERNIQK